MNFGVKGFSPHSTWLIPTATLIGGYYYSCGKDKETEAREVKQDLFKVPDLASSLWGSPLSLWGSSPRELPFGKVDWHEDGRERMERRSQRPPRADTLARPPPRL